MKYPISDAYSINNQIVVLYDPDAFKGKFRNLECFSLEGEKDWTAELPDPGREDYYFQIASYNPLKVYSFTSYTCQINIKTGKIEQREFSR